MRINMEILNNTNEINQELVLAERENLWSDLFKSEYKSDYDFSLFFKNIEKYINKNSFFFNHKSLKFLKNSKEEYTEVINLVKNNSYKVDIKFLESLDNKKKYLISSIFIDSIWADKLSNEFRMWKSLFIWMSFWYNYRWNNLVDSEWFEELIWRIKDNFNSFNSSKLIQAYRFIRCNTKIQNLNDFFFSVINEYNLIKNIDNDVKEINKENSLNLWKDFSLWTFHTRSELWFWREIKYWNYWLDKDWNETNIQNEWDKTMVNEKGEKVIWAYALDRNHKSINADVSWIEYQEYIDSPSWIALFNKGKPIACICFYIKNWNEFFINQIQKVVHYEFDRYWRCIGKRYSDVVRGIDWKTILYDVVKELAGRYNIKKIVIQWWENNRWINEVWKDLETPYFKYDCLNRRTIPANKWKQHLSVDIAKKIYDVFAEKQWFHQSEDWNREKEI